jgi:hypothetical protein
MNESSAGNSDYVISSSEIATYTVCPRAWQLKRQKKYSRKSSDRSMQGLELRRVWVEEQDLYERLKRYAKVTYLLLVAIVIVVFLIENRRVESQRNVTVMPSAESRNPQ